MHACMHPYFLFNNPPDVLGEQSRGHGVVQRNNLRLGQPQRVIQAQGSRLESVAKGGKLPASVSGRKGRRCLKCQHRKCNAAPACSA